MVAVEARHPGRGTALLAALALAFAGIFCGAAAADQLVLPRSLEARGSVEATYRFDTPQSGRGFLDVEWTDTEGRIVEERRIPVALANSQEIAFPLDLGRAVTVENKLVARLSLDAGRGEREARVAFPVRRPGNPWSDYQIIMWQHQTPAAFTALKRLGITAGRVESDRQPMPGSRVTGQLDTLLDNDVGWYLENIATDFYSAYHRWFRGRPENWRYREAKARYWKNPRDSEVFVRDPSLSDPEWLNKIHDRLFSITQHLRRYQPLFYNLADEPGIADLSAFWDFDLSAPSLAAMRQWLQGRYQSLARLNTEWGSAFPSWDAVMPMTTDEAIRQKRQNFAAWSDFKEWMDIAFARALKAGTEAVHAADPRAVAAIEGAQIPGWGGYDYWRLANSVDAMELGDQGEEDEILRSFDPQAVMLTTSFERGPAEEHRVWRALLRGTRGLILWDPARGFVNEDGNPGERGREAAPYFQAIRGGLGALLINSRRHLDPIGILYSPESWRIEWLLDRIAEGTPWSRRMASAENADDPTRIATRNYVRGFEHTGLEGRFVSAEQVEQGALGDGSWRVLVLPHAIALSARAATEIRKFAERGGLVVADGEPGIFDEHGRRLVTPALAGIFPRPPGEGATPVAFGKGRGVYFSAPAPGDRGAALSLRQLLSTAGVMPGYRLLRDNGGMAEDVESYLFADGGVRILALLRDRDGSSGNGTEALTLELPHPARVYDLQAHRALGPMTRLTVKLGAVAPALLALSEEPLPHLSISGPAEAHLGGNANLRIALDGASAAAFDVVHLTVRDPAGNLVPYYSGNLLLRGDSVTRVLPFAVNDMAGSWTIGARDVLAGTTATARLKVTP